MWGEGKRKGWERLTKYRKVKRGGQWDRGIEGTSTLKGAGNGKDGTRGGGKMAGMQDGREETILGMEVYMERVFKSRYSVTQKLLYCGI